MSRSLGVTFSLLAAAVLAGCYDHAVTSVIVLNPPANLTYKLDPSGDPTAPSGILLQWDDETSSELADYRVYSRASQTEPYGLRGTTTSNTFHDNGIPNLQYYVTAVSLDGGESDASNVITVDERLALPAPTTLAGVSLDGAIHLQWADNAYLSYPAAFDHYRVYSTGYDLTNSLCDSVWVLEGTTVSPTFLVGALQNGVPRCYGVSAISIEGYESLWSPLTYDTPRPDARNIIVFSSDTLGGAESGFRFWTDLNGDGLVEGNELGIVGSAASGANDFIVTRDASGNFWLTPQRTNTTMTVYGSTPIADLDSINIAPISGYSTAATQAVPMWGYVFQMINTPGLYSYGGLRVTATGSRYVIFDWSYQTDPGNPELVRVRK